MTDRQTENIMPRLTRSGSKGIKNDCVCVCVTALFFYILCVSIYFLAAKFHLP